jgi:hypothetical protein
MNEPGEFEEARMSAARDFAPSKRLAVENVLAGVKAPVAGVEIPEE